jgi:hypothetical protein
MIRRSPTDAGAPHEFWHPGELVPLTYPKVFLKRAPRNFVETLFPCPEEVQDDDEHWNEHLDKFAIPFAYLSADGNLGYNSRWICEYRRKIMAAFLEDDTKYMTSHIQVFHGRGYKPLAEGKNAKNSYLVQMMYHAFHNRNKNKVYRLHDGQKIQMKPRALAAFVLLISDFVFSKVTMKTMDQLLMRHFSRHPLLEQKFDPEAETTLPADFDMTYTPLHEYPNVGWMNKDQAFIESAFLWPQNILVEAFLPLLAMGAGKSTYRESMYLDRVSFMVSAQWLNIVNIVGYRVTPTPYLRRCFPGLQKELLSDGNLSNLPAFARALSEFLFGTHSVFTLADHDAAIWPPYCKLLAPQTDTTDDSERHNLVDVRDNWVQHSWIHMKLKKQDVPESHPFYRVRNEQEFTITNIVEFLFFGKMWQADGTGPVAYEKEPFYEDVDENWGKDDFKFGDYIFKKFDETELESPETPKKKDNDKEYDPKGGPSAEGTPILSASGCVRCYLIC